MHRAAGPKVARSSTTTPASGPTGAAEPWPGGAADEVGGGGGTGVRWAQKFLGSPSLRRARMFFCTSDEPPPMVSMTV